MMHPPCSALPRGSFAPDCSGLPCPRAVQHVSALPWLPRKVILLCGLCAMDRHPGIAAAHPSQGQRGGGSSRASKPRPGCSVRGRGMENADALLTSLEEGLSRSPSGASGHILHSALPPPLCLSEPASEDVNLAAESGLGSGLVLEPCLAVTAQRSGLWQTKPPPKSPLAKLPPCAARRADARCRRLHQLLCSWSGRRALLSLGGW